MPLLTASLYLLCLAALFGSALFVYSRDPHSRLHRYYALLALALLGWVGTLFVFGSLPEGELLLAIGRVNFAAAAVVATASCLFVAELAGHTAKYKTKYLGAVWLETAAMTVVSLGTPLIDRAETVLRGQHQTAYGPLFALYIVHVVAYLLGAVVLAFRPSGSTTDRTRRQLRLVGAGILATTAVGVIANIVLPYWFGDFRFINVGTLSTILFSGAVGYAVFAYHLFSIRIIVRATFVLAGLLALALELYSLVLSFLAHLLPLGDAQGRSFIATALVLVVNAFTQEPVRRWLERLIDRSYYRRDPGHSHSRSRRAVSAK